MKKVAFLLLVAAVAFAASPTAITSGPATGMPPASHDALGSVISSFYVSGTSAPVCLGAARDATYVYAILYSAAGSAVLRTYTPAGSQVGSVTITVPSSGTSRDADISHLGANYLSLTSITSGTAGVLSQVIKSTGSIASSFSVTGPGTYAGDVTYIPSVSYYLIGALYSGTSTNVYTTSGSSAGSWSISAAGMSYCGGLAYATKFNNVTGSYVIVSPWTAGLPHATLNYPAGTAVNTSWGAVSGANTNGSCVGAGSASTEEFFWANQVLNSSSMYMYQIDLGNGVGIAPASLGKVKSLYR